ncbi:hypothetical protein AZA_88790 [Nitrospirillum viridazoti Y2]|nr:hypothetical protein AZA_88790 [Nitrospirillum amazonense Y2]
MVAALDVGDGVAVGHDIPLEAPALAQLIVQQEVAGAGRLSVHAVVGAHDRGHLARRHQLAEGRQVGVLHVMPAGGHVHLMARRLRPAVHGVVLGGGDHPVIFGIIALHALDEGGSQLAGQVRVLAIGFLPPAPAWVAEDVDVGRPEIQALVDAVLRPRLFHPVELHPRLGADGDAHLADGVGIKGGGQADGLGEHRGLAIAGDAVQRLAPPIVGGDVQARDGPGLVGQLRRLFLRRQAADQVIHPAFHRQAGVKVGRLGRLLRMSAPRARHHKLGHQHGGPEHRTTHPPLPLLALSF